GESPFAGYNPKLACDSKRHRGVRIVDSVTGHEVPDRECVIAIVENGGSWRHADLLRSGARLKCQSVRGEVDGRDEPSSGPDLGRGHGAEGEQECDYRAGRDEHAGGPWHGHG